MKKLIFALVAGVAFGVAAEVPFKIGVAGYTFHQKSLDETLAIMKTIDCHYLCHKDFFVKYDASDADIAAYKAKLEASQVKTVATGPLYICYQDGCEETLRKQFEFAKKMDCRIIVGVPYEVLPGKKDAWGPNRVESDKMLDVIEKLVKEYDMVYAIHNHGPDIPFLFPTAEAAMKRIAHRDKRLGVCLDIGHERRAGLDPVAFIRAHAERIYDVHLKNIKIDPVKNLAMQGPRGELDIQGIFQALADAGYTGVCHIEYERDFADNAMGLAESFGYYRGVADCIRPNVRLMPPPAGANTLSAAEKADGWTLAWDGKTTAGWVSAKDVSAFPSKGWVIKDGTLTMRPVAGISPNREWFPLPPEDQKLGGGGDIVTTKKYKDFAFKFDFRLTRAANSGVKYFIDETQNGGSAEEYQILENVHPDSDKGVGGNRKAASLYDIIPANADSILKGVGQWNSGMIVAKGSHVEHWLNGRKVLEYERGSDAFRKAVKVSKYASWGKTADGKPQPWGELTEGRILLQDHGDSTVSFCNLKIKEL